jgi:flagellar hook-associated protein 3 FlgL
MGVTGIGMGASMSIRALVEMRGQLDELQRQLGTGKRTTSYAGLGLDRGLAVGLRARLSAYSGYQQTITHVGTRLDLMQTALGQFATVTQDAKNKVLQPQFDLHGDTRTQSQKDSEVLLDHALALLNTAADDRYLFSGRGVDQRTVETLDRMIDGDGVRAGLSQIMAERRLADLGADGLGRLVVGSPSATEVSLAEDAVSPFGFKLAGVVSTLSNAAVSGPAGSPASLSVDFAGGNPNEGETVRFAFTLPDGTSAALTLNATNSATPGPGEFAIGATPDATAANLGSALTAALGTLAATELAAASAVAAGNDFFDTDAANPPRRVDGPPFDTATALVDGSDGDTMRWYLGDDGTLVPAFRNS